MNINGVSFLDYLGKNINLDLASRSVDVSLFSFTSSVHAYAMDRRFNHSLRLEVAFALRMHQGITLRRTSNISTVSTPPPLNVDRMKTDELRELVRTLTRHHGSVETPFLGTRHRLTMIVEQDTTTDNEIIDGSGSVLRPGTSKGNRTPRYG